MLAPVLAAATGLGIEVSHWSVEKMRMQRAADAAAIAGALNYSKTGSTQIAMTAATDLARINGAGSTHVQVVNGVQNASDTALKVKASETVPLTLSRIFSSRTAVTISASSTAELLSGGMGPSTGPQPCLFAMSTDSAAGINASGYTVVSAPDCSLLTNSSMNVSGNGNFDTAGIYAADAVNIPAWIPVSGGEHPNNGNIADPYASDTALQNALSAASTVTGPTISCQNNSCNLPASPGSSFNGSYCDPWTGSLTCYIKPGNYGSFLADNGGGPFIFKFAPGLYKFNGPINFNGGNTTTSGTGVTIVLSGLFNGGSYFRFNVTAPSNTQAANTGGIAGVALAGTTSTSISFSGNAGFTVDGVVYFPNATFDGSGLTNLGDPSNTCLEILAASIVLSGNSHLGSTCSTVTTKAFASVPGTPISTATLVR